MALPVLPVVAWLLLLAVGSLVGTLAARSYALRRDLLDHPGERRSHVVPTPRGGGIGIVLSMLAAMGLLAYHDDGHAPAMALAAVGLLMVAGIGWLDDHRPLTPWSRLVVHLVASCLLGIVVIGAGGGFALALFTIVLAMVLVNIWNFMDGIDGIAALQALAVAGSCVLLASDPASRWLALALAAACLGFLPLNLPRARIFLGDVGSGALGYVLALVIVLAVVGRGEASMPVAWMLLLMPPSAFVVDAALTLAARILRGERWWTPHVAHAYQRWARALGSHLPVTFAYAAWALAGGLLAGGIQGRPEAFIICVGSAWYLGGGILWLRLQSHYGRKSGLPGNQSG